MNSFKGRNFFKEVPDYEASKGERIVKALRRLSEKVRHIEQVRQIENPLNSFKDLDTLDKEELSLNDVQYQLGMLQIQFVRSLLRKESAENVKEMGLPESRIFRNFNDFVSQTVIDDKETQTGNSLIETSSYDSPLFDLRSKDLKSSTALKATASVQTVREDIIDSLSEKSKCTKLGLQPHYHLKLDDVPFILGASSSASHSVVANLQNIIAMMKSHNKALCGPKHYVQQPSKQSLYNTVTVNSNQNKEDTDSMLKELSDDLTNLNMRHKRLKDKFDNAQKQDSFLQGKRIVAENSGLISHTEEKGKMHSRQGSLQRLSVPTVRTAQSIPSLSARRKLLRSLQDFKTHLTAEDITWS